MIKQDYSGKAFFVPSSDTSKEAAKSIEKKAPTLRQQVHEFLKRRDLFGATDYEIEQHLNLSHQTASARRRELVLKGYAKDSGSRRVTGSGRGATVWIACEEAPQEPHKAVKTCPLCGGSGKVSEPYPGKSQPDLFGWSDGEEGRKP
tara:strand:+ start:2002 stop:2442 length:441 start_codon:yes stop_codon:yes gene_type:complete